MKHRFAIAFVKVFSLSILYIFFGSIGLSISPVNQFASFIWFPTGISLAALLLFGIDLWPGIFAGAFLVNLFAGAPPFTAFGIGIGNTLEAIVGMYLLNRYGMTNSLSKLSEVITLIFCAVIVSTLISAMIGTLSLFASHLLTVSTFLPTFSTWWYGDMVSNLTVTPFILAWSTKPNFHISSKKLTEGCFIFAVLLIISLILFDGLFVKRTVDVHFAYILFPIMLWIAVRFSQRASITAIFYLTLTAIWGTIHHTGTFIILSSSALSLFYTQSYIAIVSITTMVLSAAITEQKTLEKRKDDFISIASHELKTPVTSLKLYIQLLQRQIPTENKNHPIIDKLNSQVDKLNILITDLLDVSKISIGQLEMRKKDFDLNEIIQECALIIQHNNQKYQISIKGKIKGVLYGDSERIEQVIINLLSNAVKYSPINKEITILLSEKKNNAIVMIQDNGIGIPKEQQHKIFDRFYQAGSIGDKTYPGLGIGLYISKQIIKRHKGKLHVDSQQGRGSIFTLTLPKSGH